MFPQFLLICEPAALAPELMSLHDLPLTAGICLPGKKQTQVHSPQSKYQWYQVALTLVQRGFLGTYLYLCCLLIYLSLIFNRDFLFLVSPGILIYLNCSAYIAPEVQVIVLVFFISPVVLNMLLILILFTLYLCSME